MGQTKIEWADEVWNPVTGCTKVSQGCKNCYAERIAKRFWKPRKFDQVRCHPDRLDDPRAWIKPRRVFVNSMSDLFHPDVPLDFILAIFYRMGQHDRHKYIVLTKRPHRMLKFFHYWSETNRVQINEGLPFFEPPMQNVWLGVSVEDQKTADERIPLLLQTPAAVRFVSVEPMLESVDINMAIFGHIRRSGDPYPTKFSWVKGIGIDWVICGSESGPGARPFEMDWARSLRDQCREASVPFFFKQANIEGQIVKMPALDDMVHAEFPR